MNICLQCQEKFTPGHNSKGMYCSRSCSATANNKASPKRGLTAVCGWNQCTTLIRKSQRRCEEHKGMRLYGPKKHGLYTDKAYKMTLDSLQSELGFQGDEWRKYLRTMARRWAKVNIAQFRCGICAYQPHTELCHIRPLSDFRGEETLESTFYRNVVRLCPNHHWELDNGILELPERLVNYNPVCDWRV